MKKILLIFALGFLLLASASATLNPVRQGDCLDLKTVLNATSVNLSSVTYPNQTTIYLNTNMTKSGQTFHYPFCDTNKLGRYLYDYFDNEGNAYVNDFEVTYNGEEFSTSKAILYSIMLLFVIGLFVLSLIVTTKLPYYNPRDEDGAILGINKLKYAKVGLIVLSYALFVFVLFIISNVSIAFLGNTLVGKFFFTLFQIFIRFLYLLLLVSFLWLLVLIIKDNGIHKNLMRGMDIR